MCAVTLVRPQGWCRAGHSLCKPGGMGGRCCVHLILIECSPGVQAEASGQQREGGRGRFRRVLRRRGGT